MPGNKQADCEINRNSEDNPQKRVCEKKDEHVRFPAGDNIHNQGARLNKAIASSGFCSRRKADELIFQGRVKLNGVIAASPSLRVSSADKLEIDGKVLRAVMRHTYVLLNKPTGCICSARDPQGRKTVLDLLPERLKALRLFPVGRLDFFSEGLVLLTDDGECALKLTHPKFQHIKQYEVIIRGPVKETLLEEMRRGMLLDGDVRLLPVEVCPAPLPSGDTLLRMELRQGVNRQIRRMCQKLHLTILRLKRTAQGPLRLEDLPPGKCRPLSGQEIDKLRSFLRLG